MSLPKLKSRSTAALDGRAVLYFMKSCCSSLSVKDFASTVGDGGVRRKSSTLLRLLDIFRLDGENSEPKNCHWSLHRCHLRH